MPRNIWIHAVGLYDLRPQVVKEKMSSIVAVPMELADDKKSFRCDGSFLKKDDCFRIGVKTKSVNQAVQIYLVRMHAGVQVTPVFNYDDLTETLWLMTLGHPIVTPEYLYQTNVYNPD